MGRVEETIGDVTGVHSLKTSGQERRNEGDTEHKQAQTEGYVQGTKDRLTGKKDQLGGAVTGDTSQEAAGKFWSPVRLVLRLVRWYADGCSLSARTCPQREGSDPAGVEQVLDSICPACRPPSAMYNVVSFLYKYIDGCDLPREIVYGFELWNAAFDRTTGMIYDWMSVHPITRPRWGPKVLAGIGRQGEQGDWAGVRGRAHWPLRQVTGAWWPNPVLRSGSRLQNGHLSKARANNRLRSLASVHSSGWITGLCSNVLAPIE